MARKMVQWRVERVFEQSHMDEHLRAGAYEMLVPIRRVGLERAKKDSAKTCGERMRAARGA
jgi:hypothetical protein